VKEILELAAMKRERDELFARITDLSWEKMSPREQMVWASAFAVNTWNSGRADVAAKKADETVVALRKVLK